METKAQEDSQQKAITALAKRLGEPFPAEFSENAFKVRRNLLAVSMVALAITIWQIPVEEYSGFKATKLEPSAIREILMWILGYHLAHFGWYAWDSFQEWRLRLTGSHVTHVTTGKFSAEGIDYPDDPRQSTLYNWWLQEARRMGTIHQPLEELAIKVEEWEKKVEPFTTPKQGESLNFANAMHTLADTRKMIEDLKRHVVTAQKVIEDVRIPTSLQRFDKAFKYAQSFANTRWLVIEVAFPLVLGGFAFYRLCIAG